MNNKCIQFNNLDWAKLFFAIMIPFLHISFPNNTIIELIRQYLSRLGVPFFFALSGMFLTISINHRGRIKALKHFLKRAGYLFVFWIVLYSPLLINHYSFLDIFLRTPAYLWYVMAMIYACIPFCLIKNRKILYLISLFLFLLGCYYGGSYSWIRGGLSWYEEYFKTTRNGIFFSLPLMCIGEISYYMYKNISYRRVFICLFIFLFLYILEVSICLKNKLSGSDNSIYFSIPFLILYIVILLIRSPQISGMIFSMKKLSSAIYFMQFGIISVCHFFSNNIINYSLNREGTFTYILCLTFPYIYISYSKYNKYLTKINKYIL